MCELQDELGAAQSRLSFHLRVLKDAGLVTDRKEGRWVYYSIDARRAGRDARTCGRDASRRAEPLAVRNAVRLLRLSFSCCPTYQHFLIP